EQQHRGLGGQVQAGAEADALERLLAREALADLTEDRHRLLGPLDLEPPLGGEREILDVVLDHGVPSLSRSRARPVRRVAARIGRPGPIGVLGYMPASSRRSLTRFVRSHANSGSERPKWP